MSLGTPEPAEARQARPGARARAAASVFRGNVAVLALTTATNVFSAMIWYPVLPLLYRELRATDFQVSVAYGLFVVAASFFQLPGGLLADRLGRKPLIAYPTFVIAAGVLGAGLSGSWVLLTASLVVQNVAGALQMPGAIALIAESVPAERQGEAYGLLELSVSAGLGLGPALGAALLPYLPVRDLFVLSAAIYAGVGLVRVALLRETGRGRAAVAAPQRAADPPARNAGDPAAVAAGARAFRLGLGCLFHGRLLWLTLTAVGIAVAVNLTLYGPFVPFLAHDALGLSKRQIDIVYSAGPLVSALCGVALGRFVARRGAGPAVALGLTGAGVSLLPLLLVPRLGWTFGWAVGLVCAASVFVQLNFVGYDTLRAGATAEESRGVVIGALGALSGLAASVAVPVVGRFAARYGPGLALYVAAAFFALGAGSALVVGRDSRTGK